MLHAHDAYVRRRAHQPSPRDHLRRDRNAISSDSTMPTGSSQLMPLTATHL